MSAETLRVLIEATLASSTAIFIIRLLRSSMQALVGVRVAYWLWILVPAMTVAILIPEPSPTLTSLRVTLPEDIHSVFSAVTQRAPHSGYRTVVINLALAVWTLGAAAMVFAMLWWQRSFLKSLGTLTPDKDGLHRSDAILAPMLVGGWRSKIVVPADFELRYTPEERELIVAHERAHQSRQDVAINVLASLVACLCWFNPLVYSALRWLRIDQELACDALVLSRRGAVQRRYADALLKTQLATESAWRQPIVCHWRSIHPLKERIFMLKRPVPGQPRRLAGLAFIITLTSVVSYASWAGQSVVAENASILVDLKVTITNTQTKDVKVLVTQYLVRSGEAIKDMNGRPLDYACTPYLAEDAHRSPNAHGIPQPLAGQILFDCSISREGQVVDKPVVIARDGELATIETAERGGPHVYRLEITASTSAEKIAAAQGTRKK
jgi:beta-lactamase regulating signal transducer with metallopeptidase domain